MLRSTIFLLILLGFLPSLTSQRALSVYVIIAEECPISIAMAAPLREVLDQYGESVTFQAVFPNLKSDEISIRAFLARHKLKGFIPVLDDEQKLSQRLGASVTPEVVITDQADNVLYRGRITDAYSAPGKVRHGRAHNDLAAALAQLTRGDAVAGPWPQAVGCFITYLPRQSNGK